MSSNSETITTESAEDSVEETFVETTDNDMASPLSAAPLDATQIKHIVEAALMAAGQPLSLDRLLNLFLDDYQPSRDELRAALDTLAEECSTRGVELVEVGSGFRYQSRQDYARWIARLWEEKPARYSRALLETLALIAYRQPITRGEIEDIRGVSVSTNIMKTLMERDWVKVVGHRDVPGKPAMYASTKQFLDYFSLKSLSELPTLAEIRDIDSINAELDLAEPGADSGKADAEASDAEANVDTQAEDAQLSLDDENVEQEAAEAKEEVPAVLTASNDDVLSPEEGGERNNAEQNPAAAADPA